MGAVKKVEFCKLQGALWVRFETLFRKLRIVGKRVVPKWLNHSSFVFRAECLTYGRKFALTTYDLTPKTNHF